MLIAAIAAAVVVAFVVAFVVAVVVAAATKRNERVHCCLSTSLVDLATTRAHARARSHVQSRPPMFQFSLVVALERRRFVSRLAGLAEARLSLAVGAHANVPIERCKPPRRKLRNGERRVAAGGSDRQRARANRFAVSRRGSSIVVACCRAAATAVNFERTEDARLFVCVGRSATRLEKRQSPRAAAVESRF